MSASGPRSITPPTETHEQPPRPRINLAFAVFFAVYSAFMLLTLPRYGPTWDVDDEFPRATAYLAHMLGEETPAGISPWHKLSYESARSTRDSLRNSLNGCLPSLFAALTGKIFFEELAWLGYIDAYHLGLTLLWLLFIVHFYWRLGELHGRRVALLSTLLLSMAPRVVGDVHNNMKDVPALAFGTAALLELAIAVIGNRPRRVYAATFLSACAVSSKFTAAIGVLPGAVLLGLGLRGERNSPHALRAFLVPLATAPLFGVMVLIAHWPYLWVPPVELMERAALLAAAIEQRAASGPSPYPFLMAAMTTPIVVLLGLLSAAIVAACRPPSARAERTLLIFYAAWLFGVLGVFSSGRIALFDGIRHFLLFLPPAVILAAWGMVRAFDLARPRIASWRIDVRVAESLLSVVVLLSIVVPIALYHPYEVTYFNMLVGGLPGATKVSFDANVLDFEPRDYWGTSVRASMRWVNEQLPDGAGVWVSLPKGFSHVYPLRPDLVVSRPQEQQRGRPQYVVFVNRVRWFGRVEWYAIRFGELVHQEEARGVPLSFVYRLPD